MKTVLGVKYCTANEHRMKEIELEFEKTFIQMIFKRPSTVKTFVSHTGAVWFHKANPMKRATLEEEIEIEEALSWVRQIDTGINFD